MDTVFFYKLYRFVTLLKKTDHKCTFVLSISVQYSGTTCRGGNYCMSELVCVCVCVYVEEVCEVCRVTLKSSCLKD